MGVNRKSEKRNYNGRKYNDKGQRESSSVTKKENKRKVTKKVVWESKV